MQSVFCVQQSFSASFDWPLGQAWTKGLGSWGETVEVWHAVLVLTWDYQHCALLVWKEEDQGVHERVEGDRHVMMVGDQGVHVMVVGDQEVHPHRVVGEEGEAHQVVDLAQVAH